MTCIVSDNMACLAQSKYYTIWVNRHNANYRTVAIAIAVSFPIGHRLQYLLKGNGTELFEVVKFSEQPRSWFIDNHVLQGNCF